MVFMENVKDTLPKANLSAVRSQQTLSNYLYPQV